MPRYFFHVHNGTDRTDNEGSEFPDVEAAVEHARDYARSHLAEAGNDPDRIAPSQRVEIEDDDGPAATVRFADVARAGD